MKVTTVTLVFNGVKTAGEVYEMHIKDLRDTINLIEVTQSELLENMRMELADLSAIVYNKISLSKGYPLCPIEGEWERGL